MAVATSDLYDIRMRRPRLTTSDLIVLVGALVAFLAGWAIKDWHDDRVRTVEVATVKVSYPRGWLNFPTIEPEVFRAVSNDDPQTVVFLSTATTPQIDLLQAVSTNNANPARGEPGYTQLGSKPATIDGNAAVMTDYAYVQTAVGGTTVPTVIRGRQYSWLKNGELYSFSLEGPEDNWTNLRAELNRLVDKIDTGG
ncbi:MAG: hypothetical protein QOF33_3429 [Thermomicrobiales bacterium]|nr:hypothetical protein [Thermomicrobiales bacterium]